VALLETLAGYIGIAIQNAKLYASLEQKVSEYERLKDFNESIVESISVGVLAVDLEDRIESVEFTDGSHVRAAAFTRGWASAERGDASRFRRRSSTTCGRTQVIHNLYKFRLDTPNRRNARVNVAIAPAGDAQI